MTNEELFHYGVEGMRWGHRKNIPIRVKRAYHNWRINSHERDANRYAKRAEKTEFKSWANPSYVLKRGLAQAHKDRAEAHAEAKAFCDWYISNEQTIYEISNSEAVKNGKKFINDVLDGKYVTK